MDELEILETHSSITGEGVETTSTDFEEFQEQYDGFYEDDDNGYYSDEDYDYLEPIEGE